MRELLPGQAATVPEFPNNHQHFYDDSRNIVPPVKDPEHVALIISNTEET
jgi:hypothetical protein